MSWVNHVKTIRPFRYITPKLIKLALPRCPDPHTWALAFDKAIHEFGIHPDDIPMFLAHVGHESLDCTQLVENMSYSVLRLREVWPSRFPDLASTKGYARNPQALANKVYGDRMGNRGSHTNDGWIFRGHGPIAVTGLSNYMALSDAIDDNAPVINPSLLCEPEYGALSACWFYSTRVPAGADIMLSTLRVNGGRNGLADRKARLNRIIQGL